LGSRHARSEGKRIAILATDGFKEIEILDLTTCHPPA
jgi:hypothetical protein